MLQNLKFTITLFILCLSFNSMAQAKNDYNWILGYPPNIPEEYFGGVHMKFDDNHLNVEYFPTQCHVNDPAVLSSGSGRLLAYSEGCKMYNGNHDVMPNGDSLGFGSIWQSYCHTQGFPGTQHHILLPWPGDTNRAIMFYLVDQDDFSTSHLFYAIVSFDQDYPLGHVTEKNIFLLDPGKTALISAAKHANGRDWWILLQEGKTNRFFTILLESEGVFIKETQSIGDSTGSASYQSQALFTPDGKKFIRFNPRNGIDIFDFDRCSGLLSNARESGPISDPYITGGGVGCSMSSKYMYIANVNYLYQYDLEANDIFSSQVLVGVYDGFVDPFWTTFYQMLLAPDGKIYVFSTNGVKSIHVINKPENQGIMCELLQHHVKLPAYNHIGSPVIPYFRLGSMDGSPCDTLGIDNLPIAYFKYTRDTLDYLRLELTNLSYFEPETFDWDFGDGQTSGLKHPESIQYAAEGVYEICLTVSNNYGQHTYCQDVIINDSITQVAQPRTKEIQVFPNPIENEIYFGFEQNSGPYEFRLYSADGVLRKKEIIESSAQTINTSNLQQGLFVYTISKNGIEIQMGKLLKIN